VNSLRLRVVALAVLIALTAGAASGLVASRTAERGMRDQEERRALRAVERLQRQLDHLAEDLAEDLASAASHGDLSPGSLAAWLDRARSHPPTPIAVAVVDAGGITAEALRPQSGIDAAVLRAGLGGLGGDRAGGLAVCAGSAVVAAVVPLPGGNGRRLATLALAGDTALARFQDADWRLSTFCRPGGEPSALASPRISDLAIVRDTDGLGVRTTLRILGGSVEVALASGAVETRAAAQAARRDQLLIGILVAVLAAGLGVALAWLWTRPLAELAAACRRRTQDPAAPIPMVRGVAETELLADSLRVLIDAERAGHADLAQALERETTANAVNQRFLAQLAQEFGRPIRVLIAAIDRLRIAGGLDPGEVAAAQQAAAQLEERFQDVLGLAAGLGDDEPAATAMPLDRYLAGVADLLRPQAERRGLHVLVEAPAATLAVDPRLLTPILVNLAANALKATLQGGVTLAVTIDGVSHASEWTVRDSGPGLAGELADRIVDACRRGEVIPGTPGLGLGLALVLANARSLGGGVRLADNSDRGATFVVRLPDAPTTGGWRRIVTARIARR